MTPGTPPPRPRAPHIAGERAQLAGWLDQQRAALLAAVADLDEAALRRAPVPELPCLLAIIAHLTVVEAWWFRVVLDKQRVELPWGAIRPDAPPAVPEGTPADAVLGAYRAEVARSRMVLSRHELQRRVETEGSVVNTRWIVLHLIDETARYAGRVDVLRALLER